MITTIAIICMIISLTLIIILLVQNTVTVLVENMTIFRTPCANGWMHPSLPLTAMGSVVSAVNTSAYPCALNGFNIPLDWQ